MVASDITKREKYPSKQERINNVTFNTQQNETKHQILLFSNNNSIFYYLSYPKSVKNTTIEKEDMDYVIKYSLASQSALNYGMVSIFILVYLLNIQSINIKTYLLF
eukprot:308592_1